MKAFYFDGDNGEDIREEEIPADRLEEAKTARHDMIAVDRRSRRRHRRQVPGRAGAVSVEEIHAAIRRVTIALKMTPVFIGSAYKNKGVQLLLDGVNMYLPNPKEVTNIALDQDKKEEKVILESDPEEAVRRPGVQARGRALRPAHLHAHLPGVADQGRLHRQQLDQPQARQGAAPRPHALERDERHRDRDGGRHRRAVRRRVLVGRHVHRRVDQLHDDLDARARGRHLAGRRAQGQGQRRQLLQGAQPLHQGGSDLPRAPRRGVGPDHHQRHGRASPRDLHRAHEARVRLRGDLGQAAGRLPRGDRPARASSTTRTRSRPAARASTARWRATSSRCPPSTRPASSSRTTSSGGSIPREFIPACEKGFREAIKKGPLIGFPIVGVKCVINDGASHPVDSSEIAFRTAALMGFREAYAHGQADHPRADHARRGAVPRGVPGRASWASSTSAAAPSSRRRSRKASSRRWPRCR